MRTRNNTILQAGVWGLLISLTCVICLICLAGCPKTGPDPQTGPDDQQDNGQESSDLGAMTAEQMEEVQRTVRTGTPAITRCYTEELERRNDKSFVGKVVVKIKIGTNEVAEKVEIGESTLNAPSVHQCIQSVIKGWEFPRLPASAWFTYPFEFSPAY